MTFAFLVTALAFFSAMPVGAALALWVVHGRVWPPRAPARAAELRRTLRLEDDAAAQGDVSTLIAACRSSGGTCARCGANMVGTDGTDVVRCPNVNCPDYGGDRADPRPRGRARVVIPLLSSDDPDERSFALESLQLQREAHSRPTVALLAVAALALLESVFGPPASHSGRSLGWGLVSLAALAVVVYAAQLALHLRWRRRQRVWDRRWSAFVATKNSPSRGNE